MAIGVNPLEMIPIVVVTRPSIFFFTVFMIATLNGILINPLKYPVMINDTDEMIMNQKNGNAPLNKKCVAAVVNKKNVAIPKSPRKINGLTRSRCEETARKTLTRMMPIVNEEFRILK